MPDSPTLLDVFSAPFNWCDRKCERCPVAQECPVHRRELQNRWVRTARGADPDDLQVAIKDVVREMAGLVVELQRIAEHEGIDLAAPLTRGPVVLDAVRLRRAGTALATAVETLTSTDVPSEYTALALTLATKLARVAAYPGDARSEDAWDADAVPNLLLVDRLKTELARWLVQSPPAVDQSLLSARHALTEIDRIVDPLISAIDLRARAILGLLIEARAAPSPFCVTGPLD